MIQANCVQLQWDIACVIADNKVISSFNLPY
jgi:hypothetical protein